MVLVLNNVIYNSVQSVNINKVIYFVVNVEEIEYLINMEHIVYVLKDFIILTFFKKIAVKM